MSASADSRVWFLLERRQRWAYVVGLIAIAVVARLPQLLSPNLLLTGDEAVLGLMAKHVAQGKELPMFFYGQHYGFTLIEELVGALSFTLFGVGAIPLKLAILAVWIVGIVFVFLALARLIGDARSLWITSFLVLSPVWAVPSMNAWGGYQTAFTASAILWWMLAQERSLDTTAQWVLAGLLTSLIYFAQRLWLPGVLPFVAAALVTRRRWVMPLLAYLVMTAAPILLLELTVSRANDVWGTPSLGNSYFLGALPYVGQQIYLNFTGAYYLSQPLDPPGPVTRIMADLWCGLLVFAVSMQVYRLATKRYLRWSHLFFASVVLTLGGEWLLLFGRSAHYLLPLSAPLILLVGIELADLMDRRVLPKSVVLGFAVASVMLGSVSMYEFRAFNFLWPNPPASMSEAKRLQRVFAYLKTQDVHHVFSMNGLLDTQLIFYSDEQVIARWTDPVERYQAYVREVDRALAQGERVAVVGYTDTSGAPGCVDVPICTGDISHRVANPEAIYTVDGKYFVYVGADRKLLEQLRFRFWETD